MDRSWLKNNTFHYSEFNDLHRLVDEKQRKNLTISLCLPTLNEEKTIAKEILILRSELMSRYPLLDEIVVVDSGSTDPENLHSGSRRVYARLGPIRRRRCR